MARTTPFLNNFYSPKVVRAIKVRLYCAVTVAHLLVFAFPGGARLLKPLLLCLVFRQQLLGPLFHRLKIPRWNVTITCMHICNIYGSIYRLKYCLKGLPLAHIIDSALNKCRFNVMTLNQCSYNVDSVVCACWVFKSKQTSSSSLNCSSLNSHVFTKNIIDSPLCICGAIEDTSHYLFVCTRYLDLRQDLINAVSVMCEPTLNVLLYGNTELSYEQNKEIFLSVQNYIIKSKRFQIQ